MRVLDTGYRNDVRALAFSPDGGSLAVGLRNRGASVHDLTGGGATVRLDDGTYFTSSSLAFGADGREVHGITRNGRTGFDPATGRAVGVGPTHPSLPGRLQEFVEAGDGTRLVTKHYRLSSTRLAGWTPAEGGWVLAWDIEQGYSSSPALHGDRVVQVGCLTPGGWDYQLIVLDAATGGVVGTGGYDYGMLARPHVRPDGRQIVATHEMTLVVWDARRLGKPVRVRNDSRLHFTAAAFHPSGRYLFTTSNDATVTVWDTDEWVRVKRFAWDIGRLRSVAVSADGLLAAAGSDRGRVVVWDVDV